MNLRGEINETRVFKKCTPNNKITAYLGKRDFVDHLSHVDPIDGVVLIDPNYLNERKVFVCVMAAFRYGREDLDVLGLAFRKDLYCSTQQVYPGEGGVSTTNSIPKLTGLQERLLRKLGSNAYPFYFELPHNTPASVTLQPGFNDNGKPCGVDYELKVFVAEREDDIPQKRNSLRLAIRKLLYAPEVPAPQPTVELTKDFLMSSGSLRLEATLDKEKYYHGESIAVNVLVDNSSRKTVKKIKISVIQLADIMLFNRALYKCPVDEIETDDGFPIPPNHTGWCKVYVLCPLLVNNRDKRGLALDGKLKSEDTNLASSTIIPKGGDSEALGIIVKYKVKVRLYLTFGSGDVSVELPFTLTHPRPIDEAVLDENTVFAEIVESNIDNNTAAVDTGEVSANDDVVVDTNLISLTTVEESNINNVNNNNPFLININNDVNNEDDLIFEFARSRISNQQATN